MFLRKTERVAEYKNLGWKLLGNLVSSETVRIRSKWEDVFILLVDTIHFMQGKTF